MSCQAEPAIVHVGVDERGGKIVSLEKADHCLIQVTGEARHLAHQTLLGTARTAQRIDEMEDFHLTAFIRAPRTHLLARVALRLTLRPIRHASWRFFVAGQLAVCCKSRGWFSGYAPNRSDRISLAAGVMSAQSTSDVLEIVTKSAVMKMLVTPVIARSACAVGSSTSAEATYVLGPPTSLPTLNLRALGFGVGWVTMLMAGSPRCVS